MLGLVNSEPSWPAVVSPEDVKTYNGVIRSDLEERKDSKDIAKDRNAWKSFIRNYATHTSMGNGR